jgi:hypothetical protein
MAQAEQTQDVVRSLSDTSIAYQRRGAIRRGMFEVADSRSKSRPLRVPRFSAIGH